MKLRLKRDLGAIEVNRRIEKISRSSGKFLTEEQLADVLGMSVKDAVQFAVEHNFSRIPVKGSHYYSKRQIQAYLKGECNII